MKRWQAVLSIFIMLFFFSGISYGNSNRVMDVTINKKTISVSQVPIIKDGQVIDIEYPSFVHIDRTLVPVRVAEVLGAKVDWEQETRTAIVKYKDKNIRLTIDSSVAKVNDREMELDNNSIPRLVTYLDKDTNTKDTRTMVPLAFISEMLGYDVGWDEEARAAFINTSEKAESEGERPGEELDEEGIEEGLDQDIEIGSSNKVVDVTRETIDGKKAVVIHGTKNVKYNTMKLKNPERIVVDVLDSVLEGSTFHELPYEVGFIKGLRIAQFVPDKNYSPDDKIVRIVLDIKEGVLDSDIEVKNEKDKIIIFPEENAWENVNYHIDGKDRTLTISKMEDTSYSINYDAIDKSMEIAIPKSKVDLLPGTLTVSDGLVDDINVVEESNEIKLYIQFTRGIEYDVLSNKVDDKIVIQFRRDFNIKAEDRVIVIDPGHGGIKPGSISPNGVIEKDLALDISLKLQKALRDSGYNIIMTRDSDSHVELDERAEIANRNFADIFISIHANSFTSPSANGIEVLYTPKPEEVLKEQEQYDLAKFVLDEVIKETKAVRRGVIERPNLVVTRRSQMPAILVEVGFLSNPEEEKLITNSEYQDKIIKGIVKGVENYFDLY